MHAKDIGSRMQRDKKIRKIYVIKVKRKESLKKKGMVCIIIHYPDVKNEKLFIGFSEMHIIDLDENSVSEVMVKT